MKRMIVSALAVFCLTYVNTASACRYVIDQYAKKTELEKVAVASLGDVTVISSSVEEFKFFESKPTPMCPEEMTYSAVVTVAYENGMNSCRVELRVSKVEAWDDKGLYTYSVADRNKARCKK